MLQGAFSQDCVSLLQLISRIMEKTQYKDTFEKVTLPIPETECLSAGFSNDNITKNTVPSSSKADLLHRKYMFWNGPHTPLSSTWLNISQKNVTDML